MAKLNNIPDTLQPEDNASAYAGVKLETVARAAAVAAPGAGQTANDAEFSFTGEWEHERQVGRNRLNNPGYYNYTLSKSETPGSTARYTFSHCEGVALYGPPASGDADIFLDDNPAVRISCAQGGCLFLSGPLPAGKHTITITVVSGRVELDRLEGEGQPGPASFIENGNGAFVYATAGFTRREEPAARSGFLLAAQEAGEVLEAYYPGPFLRIYGVAGPEEGAFVLRLDNGPPHRLSARAPKKGIALLWETNGLAAEYHSVRIETESPFALDGLEVSSAVPLMTVMNTSTDQELEQMRLYQRKALDPADWKPVTPATSLPAKGVKLLGGLFEEAFQKNIQYLTDSWKLPYWVDNKDPDRIWVDILSASNEGRMLIGMGHTLRFKEVPEFREAIAEMLKAIERRQFMNGNGWIMPYASENYKISTFGWPGFMRDEQKNYDRAMFTKGMLAAGQAGFTQVYPMLRAFYDWFNSADEYLPLMLLGAMGIQGSVAGPLVYHSPAGVPADILTNIKYYDMEWWLEYLANGYPEAAWRFTLNRPHNYLLTSIRALFLIYLATGEKRYLDACLGAWHIYHSYFQLPGGGITLCEHHECLPWSHKLNNLPVSVFETCGNVFWIELNSHLLSVFPEEEKYANEIEESVYNFLLSSQASDGRIRYFNQLNGTKYPEGRWNTCCEIQGTQFFGQLPQYIISVADKAIHVNLFAPAEITHQAAGGEVTLQMDTGFPYSPDVRLKVCCDKPLHLGLHIRVPSWATGPVTFTVNGQEEGMGEPGSYFTINRVWQGEEVTFTLPMGFRLAPYVGAHRLEGAARYAILYGPMLMALCGPFTPGCFQAPDEPSMRLDVSALELPDLLEHRDGLTFALRGAEYVLRPYFEVPDGATFTCFPGLVG